jgi:UDP-N-acetylmuramate dehydrogenase
VKSNNQTDMKNSERLYKRLMREFPDNSSANEPLAPFTTYQVGGYADILIYPSNLEDLEHIVKLCNNYDTEFFVIGKGANVLVHDDGFRGVIVSLEKCSSQLFHEKNLLYVGAGVTVQAMVKYCEEHSLAGLDFMSGIPGTVGGALRMNAGAFVGEIGDRVLRIDAMSKQGIREQISAEEADFGYRRANGLQDKILLGCWLLLIPGEKGTLQRAREGYLERRASKQPLEYPSCGSVFKRPPGDYAGRLIEAAEAKGFRVGGAMVSSKHANFVVNEKNATANDIYEVIVEVQQRVYKKFGVWLELEVKLVGFSIERINKVEGPRDGTKIKKK